MAFETKTSGLGYNNLYGIFVGIEKFPNSSGEIRNLWHANQDAHEMCDLFFRIIDHTAKKHELRLLVDPAYVDEIGNDQSVPVMNATRSNIKQSYWHRFLWFCSHNNSDFPTFLRAKQPVT